MADPYSAHHDTLEMSAVSGAAITPNDSADLPGGVTRAVYVGTAGDLVVTLKDDAASVTLSGVAAGVLPIRAKRVHATGTAAAGLVALY